MMRKTRYFLILLSSICFFVFSGFAWKGTIVPYLCTKNDMSTCEWLATYRIPPAIWWASTGNLQNYYRTHDKQFLYRSFEWLRIGAASGDKRMLKTLNLILTSKNEPNGSNYLYLTLQIAAQHGDSEALAALKKTKVQH